MSLTGLLYAYSSRMFVLESIPFGKACVTNRIILDRTKRIRDARAEAQKEIETYRAKKEGEFQSFESEVRPCYFFYEFQRHRVRGANRLISNGINSIIQHSSGFKVAEGEADKEAEAKLGEIQVASQNNGSTVIDNLIQAVVDVNPRPPQKIVKA